jgi:hypothetical protein
MAAVVVEEQREREGSGRVASGYSLLFDAKQIGQGEKGFFRIPGLQREIPSRSSSLPLVGLKEKEKI